MYFRELFEDNNSTLYLVSAGDFAARHVQNNPLFVSVVDLIVFVVMSSQLFHGGAGGDVSRTQIIPEGSTSNLSRQTGFDAVKEIVLRVSLGMETMVDGWSYLSITFLLGGNFNIVIDQLCSAPVKKLSTQVS